METFEYKGEKFVVVRFNIDHYTNINVYDIGMYDLKLIDEKTGLYLQKNPQVKIVILEEAEVDHFFRRPVMEKLSYTRAKYKLSNEVLVFFQGTGQENFISSYLRRIPHWISFIQAHSAPYNLIHNWVKTYSPNHFAYEDLAKNFTSSYFLKGKHPRFPNRNNINLKKKFVVFAGKPRVPRLMILDKLLKINALDFSYYNFGHEYIKTFEKYMDQDLLDKLMEYHGVSQYKGKLETDFISNRKPILSTKEKRQLRDVYNKLPLKHLPYNEDKDYYYAPNFIIPDPKLYKSVFLDLVLETFNHRGVYDDDIYGHINFFTEKIFKPTLCCRPFMVLGNRFYLRDLKQKFGFKSFSDFWDESYDSKKDIRDALPIIIKNMKYLNNLSLSKLEDLLYKMKGILIHNNEKAREFLEGEEPWCNIIREYVDGNGTTWQGTEKSTFI